MRSVVLGSLTALLFGCSASTQDVLTVDGDAGPANDASSNPDAAKLPDSGGGDSAMPIDAGPPDRSKCKVDPDKTGKTIRTLGNAPAYVLYVPSTYDMNVPSAMIEALHGAGDTAPNYAQLWQTVADARNVIILTPEASSPLGQGYTWNTSDDSFILGELADVANCYSVDAKRRILHGFSAGGIMAYWLGLAHAEKFSGVAIFSADLGSAEATVGMSLVPAPWKIPVSHFHGQSDMNFPIMYALAGKTKLENAGHTFYWHPIPGGHSAPATPANALQEFDDLKASVAP